jgi:hypothetical protein
MRLAARRRRLGRLRLRAVVLSLAFFVIAWMLLFGQMVSGHDPVLGSGSQSSAAGKPAADTRQRPTRPEQSQPQTVFDPATGQAVPQPGASAGTTPQPTPQPPPVTTSTS